MQEEKKVIADKIIKIFENNRTFLISGHIHPDGDTVGSELALASWLRKKGKKVDIISTDPIPKEFNFLSGIKRILSKITKNRSYDVGVLLECPDVTRVGSFVNDVNFGKMVNIDHHPEPVKKTLKSDCSLIDPKVSSCCELIYFIMKCASYVPSKKEAVCLYTGIITDTGRFQQANTTPEALETAADLFRLGVDPVQVYRNVYAAKTGANLKLLGSALGTLEIDGNVSYMKITCTMYKKTNSSPMDSEEIINYAGKVAGTKVFGLFREVLGKKKSVKISLRSFDKADVNAVARKYGGGGHFHASGFEVKGAIQEVIKKVLPSLKAAAR
ncbi:MAG: bifunctional oligoribonuclease/PAP phosphatase NrnA [Elusimicrobia bacterium]|nr:bifunctional oligoribonuclease/PAP phosphatase NrnA [Elusimicrobiota bacterium]